MATQAKLKHVITHCWESDPDTGYDEMTRTCMLEAGHVGPHEYTPDDQIIITFAQPREEAA